MIDDGQGTAGGAGAADAPDAPGGADALEADLRRVAGRDDTADPPTAADYNDHGEWSTTPFYDHFDSWADALDAAGLDGDAARDRGRHTRVGADALREDLRRVAAREDTGDPPSRADYDAHGEWSSTTVRHRLGGGSWADALDAAGLDAGAARGRGRRGSDAADPDALRADLRRVAAREDTADPPTTRDYEAHGRWSRVTVARRLGGDGHSWAAALDAAGVDGGAARDRGPHSRVGADALREDVRRVAAREDTGDPPTGREYDRHGRWSVSLLRRRFDSWVGAVEAAGLDAEAARDRRRPAEVGGGALAADLRRVAARPDTADPPTVDDYRTHGEHSVTTAERRLGGGSWTDALDAAGLDGDAARPPDGDEYLADLRRVARRDDTGDPPAPADYDRHGAFTVAALEREFGSFEEARRLADRS